MSCQHQGYRATLLFLQFLEKKEKPDSLVTLQLNHVYYGKPSKNMIALYPLLNLKGPVLGLPSSRADDSTFYLFTAQYLSRSNWATSDHGNTATDVEEDWLQLRDNEDFDEEDSNISSLEEDANEYLEGDLSHGMPPQQGKVSVRLGTLLQAISQESTGGKWSQTSMIEERGHTDVRGEMLVRYSKESFCNVSIRCLCMLIDLCQLKLKVAT